MHLNSTRYFHASLVVIFIVVIALAHVPRDVVAYATKTTIVKHTDTTDPSKDGFWQRKVTWKSRWVKYWRTKAIYVPVWKKVWGPVVHNEWVPLPNSPPGWQKSGTHSSVRRADY